MRVRRGTVRLVCWAFLVLLSDLPGKSAQAQSARSTSADQPAVESPSAILLRAIELYRTKRFVEAAKLFERYLDFHPDELAPRKLLARCYLQLEQPEMALRALADVADPASSDASLQRLTREADKMIREQQERETRKPKPEEIEQWVAQAETLIRDKKTSEAEQLLREVLQAVPDHERALRRLAEIHLGTRRYLEAAFLYRRLLRSGAAREDTELQLARSLSWAQRYGEAIPHFESYLRRKPKQDGARFDLAEVYRWAARPQDAIPLYAAILERQPANMSARVALAMAYEDAGRHQEALREFDRVLQTDPENPQALQGRVRAWEQVLEERKRLAWVAQERNSYVEAIRLLQEYASARPEDTDVLLQLARLHSWSSRWDESEHYYGRYLEKCPDDLEARLALGEVQNWQGKYRAAQHAFLQVLEVESQNRRALVGLVRGYQWSGALEEAEPFLDRLALLEPENIVLVEAREQLVQLRKQKMRERAEQLAMGKDFAAAVEAYRQYLAAYGPDAEIERRIALLYAWNRQYPEAVEEYRSYLVRHPQNRVARLELADVQRWKGDYAEALQNYSAFLAEEPGDPRALLGQAEALYTSSSDLFRVRGAYENAFRADPSNTLAATRLRDIDFQLRPLAQIPVWGVFDSDGLVRVIVRPRVTFLLRSGYRLVSLWEASYTHQDRVLPESDIRLTALNREIQAHEGTLRSVRTGFRLERQQPSRAWGIEAQVGTISNDEITFGFGADLSWRVSEKGELWTRYEHDEAAYELNTLASLAARIQADTWRVRYRHQLPRHFEFSQGYSVSHLSDSARFGFSDNWRQAGNVRLTYTRFRRFQPAYSYSAVTYRKVSPLYFSPGLYQAHRFEYLAILGGSSVRLLTSGSLGLGRIDGTNTFEWALAPQLSLRMPRRVELEIAYHLGQSRASLFGGRIYTVNAFWVTFRFPIPLGGRPRG